MFEILKILALVALLVFVPYFFVLVLNEIRGIPVMSFSFYNWVIGMVGSLFLSAIRFEF